MMGLSKLLLSAGRIFKRNAVEVRVLGRSYSTEASPCMPQQCEGSSQNVDPSKMGVVIGVYENDGKFDLTPQAEELNIRSGGKICQHLNDIACRMRLGKAFVVTDVVPEYSAVAIVSYGPSNAGYNKLEELNELKENIRWGVGAGVMALAARGCLHVATDPAGVAGTANTAAAAAEAAHLAAWRFEEFKNCAERCVVPSLSMLGARAGAGAGEGAGAGAGAGDSSEWSVGTIRASAQNWARYLSDMPANKMAPVDLAQAALDVLCPLGIKVSAHDRSWIEAQRMEAFLTVARGSCETPIFLECVYSGAPSARPPVLLAAKGVTFDSGGLCLKCPGDMVENRGSMAGAAVALASLKALAELKVPINVSCVIPLCENMISGQCMKVGDVVRALNGISIQIEDTDMEGRLMLADALVYGQSVHKPSLVVDVATLTRGVLLATGGGAFGCFTNKAALWGSVRDAGCSSGDRPWRFPLWTYYLNQLTNDMAVDLRNKGSGRATPCLGAAFLRNFICGDWVHMDITGVGKLGHAPAPPYLDPHRMTGRPTRTLVEFFEAISRCKLPDPEPL